MGMDSSSEKIKLVLLSVTLSLVMLGSAVVLNQNQIVQLRSDIFERWYATTKLIEEGRGVYDSRNGEETLRIAWGNTPPLRATNFYYPATLLVFTVPLALFPYPTAHLIWMVFAQLIFFVGLFFVVRLLRYPPQTSQLALLACLLFCWIPYLQHMIWGQFNSIGTFFLALCLFALFRNHFVWAGICCVGLTFKPHATLLAIVFLLMWIIFQEKRWRFIFGFLIASILLWVFAEALQPGWVVEFFRTLGGYESVSSALDKVWNPYQILTIVLVGGAICVFLWKRHASLTSSAFAGCLIISLAIWALVLPVTGSYHLLPLPIGVLFLLANYHRWRPNRYPILIWTFAAIFIFGWIGFVGGLLRPEWYGWHIRLSEFAYNFLLPLAMIFCAIPLILKKAPVGEIAGTG
jgi:hypothetical protein